MTYFGVGFVHTGPTGGPPSLQRQFVVRKDTDNFQVRGVGEIEPLGIIDVTAENQVQQGLRHAL